MAEPTRSLSLLRATTIFYVAMAAIAGIIMSYGEHDPRTYFVLPASAVGVGTLVGAGLLCGGILLILSELFAAFFQSYRRQRELFGALLGPQPTVTLLYIALIASVAEELFLRGAVQPHLGLALSSVIFGMMHVGSYKRPSLWGLWALIAGVLLGWVFEETQSLIPPILGHVSANVVSMLRMKRKYGRDKAGAEERARASAAADPRNVCAAAAVTQQAPGNRPGSPPSPG